MTAGTSLRESSGRIICGMGKTLGMSLLRLIARLDIKGPNLIKGIHLEGLRVVGEPGEYARRYAEQGADELLYIDTVATLYGRNNLTSLLERTASEVFIPITVGGGIRDLETCRALLNSGADKLAINTAAIRNPILISRIAERYGSQCIVVSIEAKRTRDGWEAYTDNGRERTHQDAVEWAFRAVELGAGELLLTSVDQEGTQHGFDVDLCLAIAPRVGVPVVVSGGMGNMEHLRTVIEKGKADAVAIAHMLHYNKTTFAEMRECLNRKY